MCDSVKRGLELGRSLNVDRIQTWNKCFLWTLIDYSVIILLWSLFKTLNTFAVSKYKFSDSNF